MIALRPPSHRAALLAGLGLIVAVNAVALGGVAWNRGQEDSRLHLTQRELYLPTGGWQEGDEDPGMALELRWQHRQPDYYFELASRPGAPGDWLDERKLAELGFDVSQPPRGLTDKAVRQREREVLLVLEFEGPAFVERLRDLEAELRKAQEKAAQAGKPGDPVAEGARLARGAIEAVTASIQASGNQVREAAERLRQAAREDSRLFVVDAGYDRQALRARYPDRKRYALVHGVIAYSAYWDAGHRFVRHGDVQRVLAESINLSKPDAEALGCRPRSALDASLARYEVDVAFGRRLEPWIVGARRVAAPR